MDNVKRYYVKEDSITELDRNDALVHEIQRLVSMNDIANDYNRRLLLDNERLEAENKELKQQVPPIENGTNRYGLDVSYFRNLINRELNRGLSDFKPHELARVFARMSRAADSDVLKEREFCTD